jgi:tetratricopeptide (TPR) repeat protein
MADRERPNQRTRGSSEHHAQQASHYESLRDGLGLEGDAVWQDAAWREYALQALYHRLCQAPEQHLPTALNGFVPALLASSPPDFGFGLQWAQTILEAGQAADSQEVREWGRRLAEVWDAFPVGAWQIMANAWTALFEYAGLEEQRRATVLGWRSGAYEMRERWKEALADAQRLVELDPASAQALFGRAWVYRRIGWYEKALADCNRGLELAPDDAFGLHTRGLIYWAEGRYEEAWTDASRSEELGHRYAIDTLAGIYTYTGQYEKALVEASAAIERNPDSVWPLCLRGETYRHLGRHEEALADLNRAVDLHAYPPSLYQRALAYQCLGQSGEAEADFRAALQILWQTYGGFPDAWLQTLSLATAFVAVGEVEEAQRLCREALSGGASPYCFAWTVRELEDLMTVFPGHPAALAVQGLLKQHLEGIGFDPYAPPS